MNISVVIPAKDEEKNISLLLTRLKQTLKQLRQINSHNFEIIVVCDNCSDSTETLAKKFRVKTISRKGNPGKSKALIDGFKKAKGEVLVMMDADLSHLPEELPMMIKKICSRNNVGLVIASRELGFSDDATLIRRMGGFIFSFFTNLFFNVKLTDAINGYKIFRRQIFDNYEYTASGYAIEIELVANTIRSGFKIAEISSYEAKRVGGVAKSKVIKDGWIFLSKIFSEGLTYWWETLTKSF